MFANVNGQAQLGNSKCVVGEVQVDKYTEIDFTAMIERTG